MFDKLLEKCMLEDEVGDVEWPTREGFGEEFTERDTKPELTSFGDYVLYHGTNSRRAEQIIQDKTILPDDMGHVGITTTPNAAKSYASMKAYSEKSEPVVLRIVVDRDWFLGQRVARETGGEGKDQWLLVPHWKSGKKAEMPPEAIKSIEFVSKEE